MNAKVESLHRNQLIQVMPYNFFSKAQQVALSDGKRLVDIVVSLLALVLMTPLMILVAIAIKLESAGPVLFLQTRQGLNNVSFDVYKFRSMNEMENGDLVRQAQRYDARVTRVGYWIRRFSIDELPQLFNVIQGDMSIVGPRPHALAQDRYFNTVVENYCLRYNVRPGITGWAQISGARGETDTLEKIQRRVAYDLWYISNWSLLLDCWIILKTPFAVVDGKEAY
jgi:exopolysaccharide biosynthesis polyprenyl glycosylphosphotransferase